MSKTNDRDDLSDLGFDLDGKGWIDQVREASHERALGFVGGYELLEEIGRGGQGVVYRGRTLEGEDVAIKRLHGGTWISPAMLRRFDREVEAILSLDHPGIVRILNADEIDGQAILVMEWIDGRAITEWAADEVNRVDPDRIARVVERVCHALLHAHQRGVIHRDLKPSNILVDAMDEPHILDFGMAKITGNEGPMSSSLTVSGQFLGTLAYASPEQIEAAPGTVDARSDLYSVGVIFYQMLTGTMPYPIGGSIPATIHAITSIEPTRPSGVDGAPIDRSLEAVVLKTLSKSAADRYQSIDALSLDLGRYRQGAPVEAKGPGSWYILSRLVRRHRVSSSIITSLALLVVSFGITMTVLYAKSEREAARAERVQSFLQVTLADRDRPVPNDPGDLVQMLDRAGARVADELVDEPEVEVAVRVTLARSYLDFREWTGMSIQARTALALIEEHDLPRDQNYTRSLHMLGIGKVARGDESGMEDLRQALANQYEFAGGDDLLTTAIHVSLGWASWACLDPPRYEDASWELLTAGRLYETLADGPTFGWARALESYASMECKKRSFETALPIYERALVMFEEVGGEPYPLINCLEGYATALRCLGKEEAAGAAYERAIELRDGRLDDRLPPSYANLGSTFLKRGMYDRALENYHAAIIARCERLSVLQPEMRTRYQDLADQIRERGLQSEDVPVIWITLAESAPEIVPLFQFTAGKIADTREELGSAMQASSIREALAEMLAL